MGRRMVFRQSNGRYKKAPSLCELMPNVNAAGEVMICGKCGHEWRPVLTTGCCPKCDNQENHKFKEVECDDE
jgi:rubrerythrin